MSDTEEIENPEVFLGLWLPTFVRVDDQQARSDGTHTGEHVADESRVTRHVDERHNVAAGRGEMSEAEIDREPAFAFFGPAIGVGTGQSPHERRLAMIDVAGRGDDAHDVSRAIGGRSRSRCRRPDRPCADRES